MAVVADLVVAADLSALDLLPAAALGGLLGALLPLDSGEKLFSALVPWLILLAVLAVLLAEILTRLNGLKQALALGVNLGAALLFLGSEQLHWGGAAVMALAALAGGALGGGLASRINPGRLRAVVVLLGLGVATVFFLR